LIHKTHFTWLRKLLEGSLNRVLDPIEPVDGPLHSVHGQRLPHDGGKGLLIDKRLEQADRLDPVVMTLKSEENSLMAVLSKALYLLKLMIGCSTSYIGYTSTVL
jgi:hypothetical protein